LFTYNLWKSIYSVVLFFLQTSHAQDDQAQYRYAPFSKLIFICDRCYVFVVVKYVNNCLPYFFINWGVYTKAISEKGLEHLQMLCFYYIFYLHFHNTRITDSCVFRCRMKGTMKASKRARNVVRSSFIFYPILHTHLLLGER
jgi:hypothetical protein